MENRFAPSPVSPLDLTRSSQVFPFKDDAAKLLPKIPSSASGAPVFSRGAHNVCKK